MDARIHQLFGAALDQSEAQRMQWLRQQCGEDDALHAAVARLLHADALASVLDGDVAQWADPLATQLVDALSRVGDDCVSMQFGPYVVRKLLGRGGMGSVWLAERSIGGFQQQVAIKLMAGALPSEEALQRFAQERQILARLQHPNIARVLDGGSVDGAPWFAMDYVEGVALDEYVRRHALSLEDRLRLFNKVVAAVQFAHQNLVVHRDLKPSNVLVDDSGAPRLLDFGVAKLLDEGSELTASRAPMSMAYAAPEQIAGHAITTATDIYSLGVVLYELLSGSRPHKPRGNGNLALMQAITDTDPEPPSRANGARTTRASRRIRGDLDTIVMKCLSRDPLRRYSSAQALGDDIDAFLRQLPIRARPESFSYRAGKFVRRHPLAVALGLTALCAVIGLSVYSTLKAREAERERLLAIAETARATAVQDFLIGIFEQQRPDESRGASISAKDLLDRAEQKLASGDGLGDSTRGALLDTLSRLRYDLGDQDAALRLNEQALQLAEQGFTAKSAEYAFALSQRSDTLQLVGKSAQAVSDCQRAVDMLRQRAPDDARRLSVMIRCAGVLSADGKLELSQRMLDDTAATITNLSVAPSLHRDLLRARAMLAFSKEEHALAKTLNTELIDALARDKDSVPSDMATALHSRASSAVRLGQLRAGIDDYRKALAIHLRLFGPRHVLTMGTQSALALRLHDVGEHAEADRLMHENLINVRASLGADNPALVILLSDAAVQAYRRRDYAAAADLLQESLDVNIRAFGPRHADTLALLNNLSSIRRKIGQFDAARAAARQVLDGDQSDRAAKYHLRQAHIRLAMVAEAVGDSAETERQAQQVLALLDQDEAVQLVELPEALSLLAFAQLRSGQPALALATAEQMEKSARANFEIGSSSLNQYLACAAWVAIDTGDAKRALQLSGEALVGVPISSEGLSSASILRAAMVRFRALVAVGRDIEAEPWRRALSERSKTLAPEEQLDWQSVAELMPSMAPVP